MGTTSWKEECPDTNSFSRKHMSHVAFSSCIVNTDLLPLQLLNILQGSVSFCPPCSYSLFENELCILNILDSAAVNVFRLWITPTLLGKEEFKTAVTPNFKKKKKKKIAKHCLLNCHQASSLRISLVCIWKLLLQGLKKKSLAFSRRERDNLF